MHEYDLQDILDGCLRGQRSSQRALYDRFYGFALTVCRHYSKSTEEAREIMNDGFVKVFRRMDQFRSESSFRSYLRRVMVNAAIDYYRKYHRNQVTLEQNDFTEPSVQNDAIARLSLDEVLLLVQQLPPTYRLVFNLYVIEGYKHHEIAGQLEISIGTSKSNLSKARAKLRQLIALHHAPLPITNDDAEFRI